ncbi:peptidoglycan-binding protein [Streptomyces sp. NPDC048416]|uniref:peptidoglycan-binding domain-containing protein n=1 Tax=Streptomyces sp. NPDC048416 TaxID=3365546 RepID=UPI00371105F1
MDGRPGCACAERAAETLHAERMAEAAAAEDFDPLRIRPYVMLPNAVTPPEDDARTGADSVPEAGPEAAPAPDAAPAGAEGPGPRTDGGGRDETGRFSGSGHAVGGDGAPGEPSSGGGKSALGGAGSSTSSGAGNSASGGDRGARFVGDAGGTRGADAERTMRLGAAVPVTQTPPRDTGPYRPRRSPGERAAGDARRRRRIAALTAGAATAVVIATAAFASTLFADDATPKQALPDTVDTGVPYSGADASAAAVSPTARPATKRATPSRSASAHASPSPSASKKATPTPSKSVPAPAASPPSGPPPSSRTPEGRPLAPPPGQTLRRGDSGPGVLELQERLAQLGLYNGNADGSFGSRTERSVRDFQSYVGVTGDPAGVYGPATRQALESMTDQP